MHGLVNHALEGYLRDTFGAARWQVIAHRAGLGFDRFEPLMSYPPDLTEVVVAAASDCLGRSGEALLEDLGTWLVSPRSDGRLRRLLRFGGLRFVDFLHSLEELPARAKLALPDFTLPRLRLTDRGAGVFHLRLREPFDGAQHVFIGLLRAMADDYGALVLIEKGQAGVTIHLLDADHAEARHFDLAASAEC